MATIHGTNNRLVISETVDSDLYVEVSMAVFATDGDQVTTWLTEEDAANIVKELSRIFEF